MSDESYIVVTESILVLMIVHDYMTFISTNCDCILSDTLDQRILNLLDYIVNIA